MDYPGSRLPRYVMVAGLLTILMGSIVLWHGCQSAPENRVYRIGWAENPPLQERAGGGQPTGVAVEAVREAARSRGIRLEWVEQPPDSEMALRTKSVDLWPLVVITPERRKTIYISEPYFEPPLCYVVPAESRFRKPGDLANARISFHDLPINRALLKNESPEAGLLPRENRLRPLEDVCKGNADAAFMDESVAVASMLRDSPCAKQQFRFIPTIREHLQAGIGATFEARAAADTLRAEIGAMVAEGRLAGILSNGNYFSGRAPQIMEGLLEARRREVWLGGGIVAISFLFVIAVWQAVRIRRERNKAVRAEQTVRDSEATLSSILRAAPIAIDILGPDRRFLSVNERTVKMFGYSREELVGELTEKLYPSRDEYERVGKMLYANLWQRGQAEATCLMRRKDGTELHATLSAAPLSQDDPELGAIVTILDTTERKRAEEEVRESRQMLQSVLDTIPVRVFWKDRQSTYLGCNRPFASDAGLTSTAEVVGKTDFEFAPTEQADQYRRDDRWVIETGLPRMGYEEPRTTLSGRHTWLRTSKIPLLDLEGRIRGVLCTYEDITDHKQAEIALKRNESILRATIESSSDGILVVTEGGRISHFNSQFRTIWSIPDELQGERDDESLVNHVSPKLAEPSLFEERIRTIYRSSDRTEETLLLKDGRTIERRSYPVALPNHEAGRVWLFRDVTERKRVEQSLRVFQFCLDNAPESVHWLGADGRLIFANSSMCRALGYAKEELESLHLWEVDPVYGKDRFFAEWAKYQLDRHEGGVFVETVHRRRDGTLVPVEVLSKHIWIGDSELHVAFARDITQRRRTEESLRASLEEKTALLREVHHRVKNNLQIVSSLLGLQAAQTQDPLALGVLQDTRNRIRSMALIHETLYRSDNLARVNFSAYVQNLCSHLISVFGVDPSRIQVIMRVADIGLQLDEAVPCGLIINELVSNALKHAFPGGRAGRITLDLQAEPGALRKLQVADNGVGIPPGVDLNRTDTLGLQLVTNLAGQLGASLEVERAGGTVIMLKFRAPETHDHA